MKRIFALFIALLLVGVVSGCGGSQSASSHDFIDLETNYDVSDVTATLYKYFQDDEDDSYTGYLCDYETEWKAITLSVSIFCADVSCPLRGLDANGCVEHCKKILQRPSEAECAPYK